LSSSSIPRRDKSAHVRCFQEPETCPLYQMAEPKFRDALIKNPHLFRYIHNLDHLPVYKEQLSRGVDEDIPSLIYPVGDPVFIHVLSRGAKERRLYVPIEPKLPEAESRKILNNVMRLIAMVIGEREEFKNLEEKRRKLEKYLSKVVKVSNKISRLGRKYVIYRNYMLVSKDVWTFIHYSVLKELAGIGYLEPIIRDPYIEDISVPGAGPVFIEHKVFESCEATIRFDVKTLKAYVERLGQIIGRMPSLRRPIVDGSLPDGSRINIVYGDDVSLRGPNLTIRKFSSKPLSIVQLIRFGSLNYLMAAYLWMLFENMMNVWFCGETASGKTTLMNACLAFIPFNFKVVSIEDTPEVVTPHANWVRECTRDSSEGKGVDLFDLLRAALRQRPNYIIVGEIRGKEGNVAFQAMQTGHGVIATFHAGSVEKLIQRLTAYPIEVPKTYIDNLNAVTIQSAVRHPKTGKLVRRVLGIYELLGYDAYTNRFQFVEIFSWDPVTDSHIFRGEGTSYLLEEKIAQRKGIPRKHLRKIYEELNARAEILRLADMADLTDYYQLFELFKEVRLRGPFEVLEDMRTKGVKELLGRTESTIGAT